MVKVINNLYFCGSFYIHLAQKSRFVVDLTFAYECKVDDKGRILLPGKLKNELDPVINEGFIIKRSIFSPCLELWPMKEWDIKKAEINQLNRFIEKNVIFIRKFLAGVKPVEVDGSGRINLPKDLMAFAGIEKTVVLTSQLNIIEIWDKDKYEAEITNIENFGRLAEEVMGGINPHQNLS